MVCSGRVGGPNGRYCKVSGQESFCFSTLPHHPAGRRQTCRTRLSVDKTNEATTPHGPATWLESCVLGVARRFECSEVARTAYGACASDGRSVGAWTERAPNLRGREGVNMIYWLFLSGRAHPCNSNYQDSCYALPSGTSQFPIPSPAPWRGTSCTRVLLFCVWFCASARGVSGPVRACVCPVRG